MYPFKVVEDDTPQHNIHFWKWEAKWELGVEENLGVTIEKKSTFALFALYFENFQMVLVGGKIHRNEKFQKINYFLFSNFKKKFSHSIKNPI